MSEIQVTSATIRSKASELEGLNAKFKSAVDELTSTEGVLRSEYVGTSSDAFHAEFTKNSAKWNMFHSAMSQYIQTLNTIAQTYETAESTATSIASN